MDCREALNLISSHLDGALSKDEQTALTEHMAVCATCAREMEMQQRLSRALREMGREEIQVPPELCGLVIGRLRAERRTILPRLPAAWQKAVAAAAAILLIAGSSAGINNGLKIAVVEKITGHDEPVTIVADNHDSGEQALNDATGSGSNQKDDSVQKSADVSSPVVAGAGNLPESAPDDNKADALSKTNNGISVLADIGSRALLSSEMKVTSTFLKIVADNDLTGVRTKAVALAAGSGAVTQVFPEQNNGKKIVILRLTVDSNLASGLITELAGLGSLIDRKDESNDITSSYNETQVQYRDLQARIGSVSDPEERRQMEAQAASYKQRLDAWDAETGKRIITLWLESR
ncbi:MAG: hypothetical protein A4E53_00045 [Pelotomaculum sp. PtaB.Bin104]|nr:MAG: hypothetical protein A4E53_00045 [Pelotomaculum sp. PtaB.Bin104]